MNNESAKMFTAHGVLQGYNSQALVDAKHQVILHAEAFGNGQDYGHVPPMLESAKAHVQAMGLGEDYFAGKILSADSNYHSEENLQTCAQEQLDAYIPDPHFRHRDPRFATQARHHPPTAEKFTEADFSYDRDQDCYRCPGARSSNSEPGGTKSRTTSTAGTKRRKLSVGAVRSGSRVYTPPRPGLNIWPS
jgi:hypothetical protein